jgi:hypothetical protein
MSTKTITMWMLQDSSTFLFLLFFSTGVSTQGFELGSQLLYRLSHASITKSPKFY